MNKARAFVIPNLCKNSAILTVVLITELFAIVVVALQGHTDFINRLGSVSLYCQWVSLFATASLCILRHSLNRSKEYISLFGAFLCIFIPYLVTELISQKLLGYGLEADILASNWISHSLIALIVTVVAIRVFALLTTVENRNKAEMEMRLKALQSRIKPHFLFNSLNTISELVATDSSKAEQALDSLAILFRVSLENDKGIHSLKNELSLCNRYLDLERWRIGDRLQVEWSIDVENTDVYSIPKLIIQPLVENAILHGVMQDGSIRAKVDIRESKQHISIVVENAKGKNEIFDEGHGIAIDNIRERLFVLYDDQQVFRVRESADWYKVLIRFPKQEMHRL